MDSAPTLSDAMNFGFDFQQGQGHTEDAFCQLVDKYGGEQVNDTTLRFRDGSEASWPAEGGGWVVSASRKPHR